MRALPRFPVIGIAATGALLALLVCAGGAAAQVLLCSKTAFASASGATACNGSAKPVTVTATVKTYAKLALEEVFGSPAASLQVAMGEVDAQCISPAAAGLNCVADTPSATATWYGDIRFRVKLAGLGATRAKVTGVRPAQGTIPSGRLVDGPAGSTPTVAYPIAPASPADLVTSLGNGDTLVSRSLGLTVNAADPPGAWSGNTVYSLVIE